MRNQNSRTVKLVIGFQGTNYEGWQSQKKENTVQEIFERILGRIFKEKINLVSSSRTDSGVHAKALVAHFKTKGSLEDAKIKAALNHYLPRDIVVSSAETVSPDFHARYHAKSKIYRYDVWSSPTRPLFEAPFVLWHPEPLSVPLMKKAAKHLIGKHDFSAFSAGGSASGGKDAGDEKKTHVRTVKRLRLLKEGERIRFEIEADGFLRHMVRVIVGTLLEVGRKRIPPSRIPAILHSKDRRQAGPTAKPQGLTLVKVYY